MKDALEAVNTALRRDTDNALLYLMKSHIEHLLGQSGKAYETFKDGATKKNFTAYHDAITSGLVEFLKKKDSFNAYNCFFIYTYWQRITFDKDLVVYIVKTARNYYKDRTVPLENRQKFHGLMCAYLNRKEQSLDLLRSSLFIVADNLVRKVPAELGLEQCPDKYSATIKSAAKEAMQAAENYHKTKDLRYLNESRFWRNFKELSK